MKTQNKIQTCDKTKFKNFGFCRFKCRVMPLIGKIDDFTEITSLTMKINHRRWRSSCSDRWNQVSQWKVRWKEKVRWEKSAKSKRKKTTLFWKDFFSEIPSECLEEVHKPQTAAAVPTNRCMQQQQQLTWIKASLPSQSSLLISK